MGKGYEFESVIGTFSFNEHSSLKNEKLFFNGEHVSELDAKKLRKSLETLRNKKYFSYFRENNIKLTKKKVKNSVSTDLFITQTISCIDEIDKVAHVLVKRLREWYSYYLPEFSRTIESNEKFAELILSKSKDQLLKEIRVAKSDSMGADISSLDLKPVMNLAEKIGLLYSLKEDHKVYLEEVMSRQCPNLLAVAGALIGAKLMQHAGSLKRLMEFPASTIQLLGAEKALFRHMKTGARPPRHGVIVNHTLVAQSPQKMHGKVARGLADKISIAVKVDYFKGEFIGDKLRNGLEERFKVKR